jgi:hypothetical protein
MAGTRIYDAYGLLENDVYFLEIVIEDNEDDVRLILHKDGDNIYSEIFGADVLILDMVMYELDHDGKTYEKREIDRDALDSFMLYIEGVHLSVLDLDGAKLVSEGVGEFKGEELEYERIEKPNGDLVRVFFNEDDGLVGMLLPTVQDDVWLEVEFRIGAEVSAGYFALPEDYESVD